LINDVFCAVGEGLGNKGVAIEIGAFDGDKNIVLADEARIIPQARAIGRANKFQ